MSQNNVYGGQAVIEGVMFAGRTVHVTAVRNKDNEILYLEVPKKEIRWLTLLKKIPLLRGVVAIIEASAKGAQHLNFSAEVFAEDEEAKDQEKKSAASGEIHEPALNTSPVNPSASEALASNQKEEKSGALSNVSLILGVAVVGVLSFLFGKFVFTLIPPMIEQFLFGDLFNSLILHNLIEGIIKTIILIGYIYAISFTPTVKRLFQYHGAEHKVISAYEAGVDLTVSNVQKFSTLHYRCGSSFMVFTVIVGVVIYSFFPYASLMDRLIQRIILLPLVIGVSYEVLRFTNLLRDVPVLRFLGYPGLWLQKLTTKEPDDHQVEVSIASFKRMQEIDNLKQSNTLIPL